MKKMPRRGLVYDVQSEQGLFVELGTENLYNILVKYLSSFILPMYGKLE